LSLRVTGADVEAMVKHHEPLIRNQLVMLFSQQTEEAMAADGARETLRVEALKQVQDVLNQEEGKPLVDDLLFNNLIIQ
jgi:flagellar FliL protein